MIFYKSDNCTIKYFEKEKLMFTQYFGFVPSEELRKILSAFLDLLATKDVQIGLSDNRKMKVIRPADQEYINNEWFPQFLKVSKMKKSATIESHDIFNKMATDNILRKIEGQITFEIKYFDSIEESCEWLGIDCNIIKL